MIKDKLVNAGTYYKLSERLQKGFQWLAKTDLKQLEDGKYIIDGNNIFANVQSYNTKDDAPYEAHRRYIDIQYMVEGEEKVGVTDYSVCSVKEEYNENNDIEFLYCEENSAYQTLEEGSFLVFFPHDAHQPALISGKKQLVKKVIVKVAI